MPRVLSENEWTSDVRVQVKVVPRARRGGVEALGDGALKVRVTAPAEDGRATAAVIDALADHYGVPKRAVTIVRGQTSRTKLIEVAGR